MRDIIGKGRREMVKSFRKEFMKLGEILMV